MLTIFEYGVIIQLFCAVIAASTIVYLLTNGNRDSVNFNYIICISLVFFWTVFEMIDLLSKNQTQELIALKIKFLPICLISPCWLIFCLNITKNKIYNKWILKYSLLIPAVIFYILMLTNERHHLFFIELAFKEYKVRGPVFWVHTAYSYSCLLIGSLLLFFKMIRFFGTRRIHFFLLIIAVLFPMAVNAMMLTNIIPYMGFDVTPQVFLVTMLLFTIAIYRYKMLNIVPIAIKTIIEKLKDGILIIDNENRVASYNKYLLKLFNGLEITTYDNIMVIIDYISNIICYDSQYFSIINAIRKGTGATTEGEIKIKNPNIKYIHISVIPVFNRDEDFEGRIVIFSDKTDERKLMYEISNKNTLLSRMNIELTETNTMLKEANIQLEDYSKTVQELAVTRERNRLSSEMHDTIGHTMTLIIALLENSKVKFENKKDEGIEKINQCIQLSKQCLSEIRNSLKGIFAGDVDSIDITVLIGQLVTVFEQSGIKIDYTYTGDAVNLDSKSSLAVYRICQESITNSIRHGKADSVTLTLKFTDGLIKIYIFDNGQGCKKIVSGFGLNGMQERAKELGGKILFGSDGESGFNVVAEIPIMLSNKENEL